MIGGTLILGMRGKKEDSDPMNASDNIELIDENSIDDYDNEFYENLQNERRLLNEFGQIYGLDTQMPNELNSEQDYSKRAPSVGFYGMRGKKNYLDGDDEEEALFGEKRAPAGFIGMEIIRFYLQ